MTRRAARLLSLIALLLGTLALLAFVGARLMLSEPPEVQTVLREEKPVTKPEAQAARKRMERVVEEVKQLRSQARHGKPRTFELEFRGRELEAYLQADTRIQEELERRGVTQSHVRLTQDGIELMARMNLRGRPAWVLARGDLLPTPEGAISFLPREVKVGRLPVLAAAARTRLKRLEVRLAEHLEESGLRVEQVKVTDGRLVLQGTTVPVPPRENL